MTEKRGIPAACVVTGANRHDMKQRADLLDAVVAERPATDEAHLVLDRGDAYDACRNAATSRGFPPHIPPKASAATPLPAPDDPDRHPPRRWGVAGGRRWFNRFRRLRIRGETHGEHSLGFVQLAAVLLISREVRHARSRSG